MWAGLGVALRSSRAHSIIYAGFVSEIFETDRDIAEMFHPEMIWIDISNENPLPEYGWAAALKESSWQFWEPIAQPPADVELRIAAQVKRDSLLASANEATAGMADAYIANLLNEKDVALFKSYAAYKLALSKIDQQIGFPRSVVWPASPD